MGTKRSAERGIINIYDKEDCKQCETYIREDENLKTKEETKRWVREAIMEILGEHERNDEQIQKLWKSIFIICIILLILAFLIANLYTK